MENSTKSANIGVFRSTCDVRTHQDHLPPVVPSLLIVNIVINSIFACMTVIGNTLILISLRRTSRVHAASKALYLSLAMADLGVGIFVQPVFVIRLVAARRGLTEVCRLAGNIIDVAGVITVGVSLQTLSVISVDRRARHTSQDTLQRGRNCQPNTDRFANLLVHQCLTRSQFLYQYRFLQHVSGRWHFVLYLCLVNFISHYLSQFADPSKPNPELQP